MHTNENLDELLKQAAGRQAAGDPGRVWLQIQEELKQPEQQRVPYRQLRNLGIAALILLGCNIWLWKSLQQRDRQEPPVSYNLNIYGYAG